MTFAEQALIEIIERDVMRTSAPAVRSAIAPPPSRPVYFSAAEIEAAIARALDKALKMRGGWCSGVMLAARELGMDTARLAMRQTAGKAKLPRASGAELEPVFAMVARETGVPPAGLRGDGARDRMTSHARALFILAAFDPGTTGAEQPSRARQPMPGEIMKPKRFYGQGGIAHIARAMGVNHASVLEHVRELGLTSCCCGARPRAFTPLHPIRPIITLKDMP